MKCPICKCKPIELNFNFAGMTKEMIKECPECGAIWSKDDGKQIKFLRKNGMEE